MQAKEAMALAIEEARKGAGFVSPNPLVGCVILDREFSLLSTGYHAKVGEAHAEINALNQINNPKRLEGAHLFVTLEPCAHEGRTPSCAKALAKLPLASVTFGLVDPNPQVSGKGAEILRKAGIQVHQIRDLQDELEELTEVFLMNMRQRRPFVALKVAASIDGRIALNSGESQWLTGEASRQHVQFLRGCYDAVVTGVNTFLRDNPRLNARDPRFEGRSNRVVLLDPTGKSLAKLKASNLWKVRSPEEITLVTGPQVKCDLPLDHLALPKGSDGFSLVELLDQLRSRNMHSLWVESGAYTSSHFLKAGLVDRLYLYQAPKILGEGMSWTSALKISSLDKAVRLEQVKFTSFGEDLLTTARLKFHSQN